jgi:hypothetical protein
MPSQKIRVPQQDAQGHYIYQVNSLIEDGQDDLARQVAAEACAEFGTTPDDVDTVRSSEGASPRISDATER